MIRSLRRKFIFINMLLVLLVLLIVFTILCVTEYKRLELENAAVLHRAINQPDDIAFIKPNIGNRPREPFSRSPVFVVHMNDEGNISILLEENISVTQEEAYDIVLHANAHEGEQGVLSSYDLRFLKRAIPEGGTKIAFVDISNSRSILQTTVINSLLLGLLALAAFFFISLFLSKLALMPVERAWQQQRRFIADASHELKTPLTVILANTGILQAHREDTIKSQLQWVDNTEAEAKRIKKLVDDMLFLAKSDDTAGEVFKSEVNLSDILIGSALTFESVAFEKGLSIETAISPNVRVCGNEQQLQQVARILLDNAIKYSNPGGMVKVTLMLKQNKAVCSVHNMGIPLDEQDLVHAFDRFYRADESRSESVMASGFLSRRASWSSIAAKSPS